MPYIPFATTTEKRVDSQKMVGVYIKKEESLYLSLYALLLETSISGILRKLITDYIEDKEDEDAVLQIISKKAHDEWKKWYDNSQKCAGWRTPEQIGNRWNDFKNEAMNNLRKRRVEPKLIQKIMDSLEKMEINDRTITEED